MVENKFMCFLSVCVCEYGDVMGDRVGIDTYVVTLWGSSMSISISSEAASVTLLVWLVKSDPPRPSRRTRFGVPNMYIVDNRFPSL